MQQRVQNSAFTLKERVVHSTKVPFAYAEILKKECPRLHAYITQSRRDSRNLGHAFFGTSRMEWSCWRRGFGFRSGSANSQRPNEKWPNSVLADFHARSRVSRLRARQANKIVDQGRRLPVWLRDFEQRFSCDE